MGRWQGNRRVHSDRDDGKGVETDGLYRQEGAERKDNKIMNNIDKDNNRTSIAAEKESAEDKNAMGGNGWNHYNKKETPMGSLSCRSERGT